MWTDSELDQALADQPAGPAFSPEARARVLAALRAADAAPATTRRTGKAWWLAAAAAVAVATGVSATFLTGGPAPQASAAAVQSLEQASTVVGDVHVGSGQYYYTASHDWSLGAAQTRTGKHLDAMEENVNEEWIPANRADDWLRRSGYTGRHTWIVGSDELVKAEGDGGLFESTKVSEQRGACGDWGGRQTPELGGSPDDGRPCDQRIGNFYEPTPRFIAQMPTDPAQLYDKLLTAAHGDKSTVLKEAAGVLVSADADHTVRSTVYKALMLVPGLDVTDNAANLDGQRGVALGVSNGTLRQEIVIDPGTGRYIGDRLTLVVDGSEYWAGVKAGSVVEFTSVRIGVAEKIGVAPR
ncbi:CU044_5270 family protein [Kutzneria sp. NPDC051319]|uniref:CU044_5270 family protein n=1 Tax=Kutzneria sp. NPDC051319 TaxID=3155047 RepID=UPI003423A407